MRVKSIVVVFLLLFSTALFAKTDWQTYIAQLRSEALSKGIRPEIFDEAFQGIQEPHQKVLHFDRTQPEKRITFMSYRDSRANASRITMGRQEMKKNATLLNEVSAHYGVEPTVIVSLWGLETSYGRYMGKFSVIKSLATLAYDHRRSAFFRQELFYALEILNDGHIAPKDLKGEWAGATGQPQFLPSSWHHYAVDYDGDGHKDIWKSQADIFASIANYLSKNGWQANQPCSVTVNLPANFNTAEASLKIVKTVADWEKMGVHFSTANSIAPSTMASIVLPEGGPAMMVFNNFKVIMKWNRSIYYAGTVEYLAKKIG